MFPHLYLDVLIERLFIYIIYVIYSFTIITSHYAHLFCFLMIKYFSQTRAFAHLFLKYATQLCLYNLVSGLFLAWRSNFVP